MAEARRLAPAGMSPFEHAWSVFTTASFQNSILPHLGLEFVREDTAVSFQESRARAKKHEANNLCGANPTKPDPVPNPTPTVQTLGLSKPQHDEKKEPQHDEKKAAMETTIASLSSMDTLKRGRPPASNPNRDRSSTPARRQQKTNNLTNNSINRNSNNNNANTNAVPAVATHCNYSGCKLSGNHTRENCKLRSADLKRGFEKYSH